MKKKTRVRELLSDNNCVVQEKNPRREKNRRESRQV